MRVTFLPVPAILSARQWDVEVALCRHGDIGDGQPFGSQEGGQMCARHTAPLSRRTIYMCCLWCGPLLGSDRLPLLYSEGRR